MVVITGASSGIGAATAVACGTQGMKVVLAARREDLLREVATRVEAAGGTALVCPTDVRDPKQIEWLAGAALEAAGPVDFLIANAGVGYPGPMATITDEVILRTVEVNLLGVMRCVRAFLPGMLERERGHIITISSVAAGIASPRAAVYAATKAGVHRFSEGLGREVRPHGLYVTDVLPGVIDTPMVAHISDMHKAPVESVARAILGVMRRPRRILVTPGWYRLILALNAALPGAVDWGIRRFYKPGESAGNNA